MQSIDEKIQKSYEKKKEESSQETAKESKTTNPPESEPSRFHTDSVPSNEQKTKNVYQLNISPNNPSHQSNKSPDAPSPYSEIVKTNTNMENAHQTNQSTFQENVLLNNWIQSPKHLNDSNTTALNYPSYLQNQSYSDTHFLNQVPQPYPIPWQPPVFQYPQRRL